MAMVVASPSSRIIGNFFMAISQPPFPCKMFTSEPEAISWLLLTVRLASR